MSNPHDAVAHAFAHQTGRARSGFAMFYEGDAIYSHGHHFTIARHVQIVDGSPAVLFTSRGYSNSTAKHKYHVRNAIRHLNVFTVDNVNAENDAQHAANHAAMVASAVEFIGKAKRARTMASAWLNDARRAVDEANRYSASFSLAIPMVFLDSLDEAAAEAARRAEAQRAAHEEAARLRAIEENRSIREKVRAWIGGASLHVRTPVPMVRVRGDKIETTWGASATLADALSVYRIAKRCRRTRTAIEFDGPSVDHWGRAKIDSKGNITVGCHRIPFRIAQLAACVAGIDAAPSIAYHGA